MCLRPRGRTGAHTPRSPRSTGASTSCTARPWPAPNDDCNASSQSCSRPTRFTATCRTPTHRSKPGAAVQLYVPLLAECFARQQLQARAKLEGRLEHAIPLVLAPPHVQSPYHGGGSDCVVPAGPRLARVRSGPPRRMGAAGAELRFGARSGRRAGGEIAGPDLGRATTAGRASGRLRGGTAELPATGRRPERRCGARIIIGPPSGGVVAG